jgi:hypothetical protein
VAAAKKAKLARIKDDQSIPTNRGYIVMVKWILKFVIKKGNTVKNPAKGNRK